MRTAAPAGVPSPPRDRGPAAEPAGPLLFRSAARRRLATLATAVVAALLPVADPSAAPEPTRAPSDCASLPVSIAGADAQEVADACRAIRAAVAFLASQGVPPPERLTIVVDAVQPNAAPPGTLACFRPALDRIDVLAQATFLRGPSVHGRPPSRGTWRALVAHEVAHAALWCAMPAPGPTMRAAEYVAGVTEVSALDADERDALIAAVPGQGFGSELEISSLAYLLDPAGFAVRAWRHWRAPGNGAAFIRAIVERRVLVGPEP